MFDGNPGLPDAAHFDAGPDAFFPPEDVPTNGADVFRYLQAGSYLSLEAESAVHDSTGPHGQPGVRTFINAALAEGLANGGPHPVGAAAIKELYRSDGTTLMGWAVSVKTDPDSAGGQGWYWYEVFSTTNGSNPVADGNGVGLCHGCHSGGQDYILTPYPLQ